MNRIILVVTIGLSTVLGAVPAGAGGGNMLEIEDYYIPIGTSVTTEPQGVFFKRSAGARRALGQTWDLYLRPGGSYGQDITIPEGAILVGSIDLRESAVPGVLRASASYTIPEMDLGKYSFLACTDLGCTPTIGDMYLPGWIQIVESKGDITALREMFAMKYDLRAARRQVRRLRGRTNDAEHELSQAGSQMTQLDAENERMRERIRALENAEPASERSPMPWALAGAALTLATVWAVMAYRRRTAFSPLDVDEDTQPGPITVAIERDPLDRVGTEPLEQVFDDSMWKRPEEPVKS